VGGDFAFAQTLVAYAKLPGTQNKPTPNRKIEKAERMKREKEK